MLYKDIIDIVNKHLKKYKNKKEILSNFFLGSRNFYLILTDLKKFDWFKYKREEIVEDIIQQAIANYLVVHF